MHYFYYPAHFYLPAYVPACWPVRQYPPVDPSFLYESATESKKLMTEASLVLDQLSESKELGKELMQAAQVSDTAKVKQIIESMGVTSVVDIKYNPDSLRIEFKSKVADMDCCILTIILRWR